MAERTKRRKTRRFEVDEDEEQTKAPWTDEDDDDDEEEAPPVKRRAKKKKARRTEEDEYDEETGDEEADGEDTVDVPISRGRKQIKKNRPKGEGGEMFFRWDEEPQVVKFLEDEPWSYDQHWVQRKGKQSFPCLGSKCPLCAIGVKVSQKVVYSMLNLSKEEPKVQVLEVGVQLDDTLAAHDADKKTGPLDRLYWALSRTERSGASRGGAKYNYVITPVKARDLEEDWDIDVDRADAALDKAEAPEPQTVTGKWTRTMLQDIADEVMD